MDAHTFIRHEQVAHTQDHNMLGGGITAPPNVFEGRLDLANSQINLR
jgi:hypothetical protein